MGDLDGLRGLQLDVVLRLVEVDECAFELVEVFDAARKDMDLVEEDRLDREPAWGGVALLAAP
jgi:hypothetical protein